MRLIETVARTSDMFFSTTCGRGRPRPVALWHCSGGPLGAAAGGLVWREPLLHRPAQLRRTALAR
jgi:hypothetical protein